MIPPKKRGKYVLVGNKLTKTKSPKTSRLPESSGSFEPFINPNPESVSMAIISDAPPTDITIEKITHLEQVSQDKRVERDMEIDEETDIETHSFDDITLTKHQNDLALKDSMDPMDTKKRFEFTQSKITDVLNQICANPKSHSRRRTDPHANKILSAFYENENYPSHDEISKLSEELNLSYITVRVWFQNRRQKEKRMLKLKRVEPTEEQLFILNKNKYIDDINYLAQQLNVPVRLAKLWANSLKPRGRPHNPFTKSPKRKYKKLSKPTKDSVTKTAAISTTSMINMPQTTEPIYVFPGIFSRDLILM